MKNKKKLAIVFGLLFSATLLGMKETSPLVPAPREELVYAQYLSEDCSKTQDVDTKKLEEALTDVDSKHAVQASLEPYKKSLIAAFNTDKKYRISGVRLALLSAFKRYNAIEKICENAMGEKKKISALQKINESVLKSFLKTNQKIFISREDVLESRRKNLEKGDKKLKTMRVFIACDSSSMLARVRWREDWSDTEKEYFLLWRMSNQTAAWFAAMENVKIGKKIKIKFNRKLSEIMEGRTLKVRALWSKIKK